MNDDVINEFICLHSNLQFGRISFIVLEHEVEAVLSFYEPVHLLIKLLQTGNVIILVLLE